LCPDKTNSASLAPRLIALASPFFKKGDCGGFALVVWLLGNVCSRHQQPSPPTTHRSAIIRWRRSSTSGTRLAPPPGSARCIGSTPSHSAGRPPDWLCTTFSQHACTAQAVIDVAHVASTHCLHHSDNGAHRRRCNQHMNVIGHQDMPCIQQPYLQAASRRSCK